MSLLASSFPALLSLDEGLTAWCVNKMNLLLEKKHSAAVEEFRECIALLEQEKNQAKDEDVSLIHSTLDTTISTLYCNIAIAQRGTRLS